MLTALLFPAISVISSVFRYNQPVLPPHLHHLTFFSRSILKPTWTNYLESSRTLLIIGNMLFITGDTFAASAMAYHLAKFKSWAPPTRPRPRIDILLNRLLIFCVATGALTSCVLVQLSFPFPFRLLAHGPWACCRRMY